MEEKKKTGKASEAVAIICALLVVLISIGMIGYIKHSSEINAVVSSMIKEKIKDNSEIDIEHLDVAAERYAKAVRQNDFAKANETLDALYALYSTEAGKQYRGQDYEKTMNAYWAAARYIYKAEMLYLISENDTEANERLIKNIESFNFLGKKPKENVNYEVFETDDLFIYIDCVEKYNLLCDDMLNMAITHGNEHLAKETVNLFEESFIARIEETYVFIKNTNAIDEAKKRLEEAYANGAFN